MEMWNDSTLTFVFNFTVLFNYYIGFTVKIEETKLLHSIVKDYGACQDGSLYLLKE